jgi:hypothetical protein
VIFLSYSWDDRPQAERIVNQFRMIGTKYWIDSEHLDVGRPIHSQLTEALAASSSVLVLDTASSRRSIWVDFEIRHAFAMDRPICRIPISARKGTDI